MANVGFNIAKEAILDGTLNMDTDVIKAVLVMTNTTADTEQDSDRLATTNPITVLDEMDGSGFSWGWNADGRKTLTTTTSVDDTNNRGDVNVGGSTTWATLGVGTRLVQGVLIIKEAATSDDNSVPIVYLDFAAPVDANGQDFVVNWDAGAGDILRITD